MKDTIRQFKTLHSFITLFYKKTTGPFYRTSVDICIASSGRLFQILGQLVFSPGKKTVTEYS